MKLHEVNVGQYVVLNDNLNAAWYVVTAVGTTKHPFCCEIVNADAPKSRAQLVDVSLLYEPTPEQWDEKNPD